LKNIAALIHSLELEMERQEKDVQNEDKYEIKIGKLRNKLAKELENYDNWYKKY
jgi:cytochrome c-type biogenesis protein CcmH/NrfG